MTVKDLKKELSKGNDDDEILIITSDEDGYGASVSTVDEIRVSNGSVKMFNYNENIMSA